MTQSFEKTIRDSLNAQERRADKRLEAIQDLLERQKEKTSPNPKATKSQKVETDKQAAHTGMRVDKLCIWK